jgi:hypothetical protein
LDGLPTSISKDFEMTTEWTELKTGKEVFDRQAEGWEIDDLYKGERGVWDGLIWRKDATYFGRPAQPNPVPQDAGGIVKFSNYKDGLWAHFDLGDGSYKYTINLDADHMSSKFADAYRKKFAEPAQPKTKTVTSECWRNPRTGELTWANNGEIEDDPIWQRFPAGDFVGEVNDE